MRYTPARAGAGMHLGAAFMNHLFLRIFCFLWLGFLSRGLLAVPTVSNVTFAQRTDGSDLVDISYDLAGGTVPVSLAVSYDDGANYTVVAAVSGDVGPSIDPGLGKRIVWNARADYPDARSAMAKVRVTPLLEGTGGVFAPIPAGTFRIGNQTADPDLADAPVTSVTLSSFFMSVDHTTKAQWDTVAGWASANGYTGLPVGGGKAAHHPVHGVDWYGAVLWANAASEREGLRPCYWFNGAVYRGGSWDAPACDWSANGYRLPTEAEWEAAARGGLSGKRFPWGDTISHTRANYNSSRGPEYDLSARPLPGPHPVYGVGQYPYTSPVGSFAANGYGLRDMAGNIRNWCWDLYGAYVGGVDPRGARQGEGRVVRGGNWDGGAAAARSAYRKNLPPTWGTDCDGFRLVRRPDWAMNPLEISANGVLDTTAPSLFYSSAVYPAPKGAGEMVLPVTVCRNRVNPQKAVSVEVTTGSDTLLSEDYLLSASPVVLRWAAGDTSEKTFSVIFRAGRTIADGGEFLRLTLQNPVGAYVGEIGAATVALMPRNSSNPGFLNFESAQVERAKPGAGDLTVYIPVQRVQGGTGAVSANVVVSGGTARPGDFIVANPVRLEWADGDMEDKTFPVVFKEGAAVPAGGKTVQFRLQNLSGGVMSGGTTSTTLAVRSATQPGTLNLGAASYAGVKVALGDTVVPITVNREQGGNGAVSVQVVPAGGTATADADFVLPANPVMLNWADDEMGPKTFNVVLKNSAEIASGGETLLLKLQSVTGGAQLGRVSACRVAFTASDTAAPELVLESPAPRSTVTGESVLFKGTVTDVSGVNRVEVTLNSAEPRDAVLMPSPNGNTFAWMATLVPEQGVNMVKVQAFDGRGNASAMLTRQFTFLYSRPALKGTFDGRFEPATVSLEQSEQVSRTRVEGLLTATVSATGSFTGKLTTEGIAVSFKGVLRRGGEAWFDSETDTLEVAKGRGASRVVLGSLSLRAQETGELPRLVGELVSNTGSPSGNPFGTVLAEKFVYSAARVLPAGMRRVPVAILDPASENGRYTALFEPRVDEGLETNGGLERTRFPQASGFAQCTVASSGVVSLKGRLADGTVFSYGNRLSPSGAVPVYLPLYSGRGFLSGTPVFDDAQPETDLAGAQMRWVRPAGLPPPFEAGWENGITVDLLGSKYVPITKPTRTVPAPVNTYTVFGPELPVTALVDDKPDFLELQVKIGGGGLTTRTTDVGQLSPTNVFKVTGTPGAAGLKLVFTKRDGGFTGSFTHPVSNKAQTVAGVVLQKAQRAGGWFMFQPTRGSTAPAAVGTVGIAVP